MTLPLNVEVPVTIIALSTFSVLLPVYICELPILVLLPKSPVPACRTTKPVDSGTVNCNVSKPSESNPAINALTVLD